MDNVQLSDNFTLAELIKSDVAARKGIDNTPSDPAIVVALRALATNILQPVRDHFGIAFSPNSGYRCPALNALVGSAPTSQHILGQAADFELPGIANHVLAQWIQGNLSFDQLILEFYVSGQPASGWVHCSYVSVEKNRRQTLTTPDGKTFSTGLVP